MLVVTALLAFIGLLLALPLELEFDTQWPDTGRNRVGLRWAFGIVRVRLPAGTPVSAGNDASKPGNAESEALVLAPQRGKQLISMIEAARVPGLRQRLWRFLGDLWRALRKDNLYIGCRIGLETPADTGMLWGVAGPAASLLQRLPDCRIVLSPEFDREIIEVTGRGTLRLYPLEVIVLSVGLLASPVLWRGLSAMRSRS